MRFRTNLYNPFTTSSLGGMVGMGVPLPKNHKVIGTPKINNDTDSNGYQPQKPKYTDVKKVTMIWR